MNVDFGTNDIDEILSIIRVFKSNELFEIITKRLTAREETVLFHRIVEGRTLKYVAERKIMTQSPGFIHGVKECLALYS